MISCHELHVCVSVCVSFSVSNVFAVPHAGTEPSWISSACQQHQFKLIGKANSLTNSAEAITTQTLNHGLAKDLLNGHEKPYQTMKLKLHLCSEDALLFRLVASKI